MYSQLLIELTGSSEVRYGVWSFKGAHVRDVLIIGGERIVNFARG
jgi:hypothetical protein